MQPDESAERPLRTTSRPGVRLTLTLTPQGGSELFYFQLSENSDATHSSEKQQRRWPPAWLPRCVQAPRGLLEETLFHRELSGGQLGRAQRSTD